MDNKKADGHLIMMDWRTRLRGRLAASGKTRAQVCSEAGLNPAYLTQILEQKGATPRIDNLSKLATVLNTTVCYLVDGIEIDADTTEALSLYECLSPERKQVALILLRDMAAVSTSKGRGAELQNAEKV